MFKVGDLVTEDYKPMWYYGLDSYYYGYGDYNYHYDKFDDMWLEEEIRRGGAPPMIGLVIEVCERAPTNYRVTPHYVYRIKWLNPPPGEWLNWRCYREDELKLISSIEAEQDE